MQSGKGAALQSKEEKKAAKAREARAKAAAKRAKKEREEEAAKAKTALEAGLECCCLKSKQGGQGDRSPGPA